MCLLSDSFVMILNVARVRSWDYSLLLFVLLLRFCIWAYAVRGYQDRGSYCSYVFDPFDVCFQHNGKKS